MSATIDNATALRLQLLKKGYTPLANFDKRNFQHGWARVDVDEAMVQSWESLKRSRATGLRIQDGLTAIDVDILDQAIVDAIADAAKARFGDDFFDKALLRGREGSPKEMWLARMKIEEASISNLNSRLYTKGSDLEQVQIFCKPRSRQIGAFGAHSHDDFENVLAVYSWDRVSPLDVPLKKLPLLKRADLVAFIADVDALLERAGYQLKVKEGSTQPGTTRYDLKPDMDFDGLALDELRVLASADPSGYRITARFVDPQARSLKCIAHDDASGFWIHNFDGDFNHRLESEDPDRLLAGLAEDFAEFAEGTAKSFPNAPEDVRQREASAYMAKLTELLRDLAWTPYGNGGGIEMSEHRHKPNAFSAMKHTYAKWFRFERVGRSVKKINIIEDWDVHDDRIIIHEVHMRPSRPWPTYREKGRTYANLWRPIVHDDTSGTTAPFWTFLGRLIPDADDLKWFSEALAHKTQHPEVPGPATVMVADNAYGTGRSTLGEIIHMLFLGRTTVARFEDLTGRGPQAQWNANRADALWCISNEAVGEDGGSAKTRHAVFENLKEMIDPSGTIMREFKLKFAMPCVQPSPCTDLILSNNIDAIRLPANDRRFMVILNRDTPMSEAERDEIRAWMKVPGNIGALFVELQAMAITVFDPYRAPPMTEGKLQMVEQAKGEVEEIVDRAFEQMKHPFGFREQVFKKARVIVGSSPVPDAGFLRAIKYAIKRRMKHHVGYRDGANDRHLYDGERTKIYATSKAVAEKWRDSQPEFLRGKAMENDAIMDEEDTTNPQSRGKR